ncbi:dodecin domain-containing protein [Haloterrigena sp. SYSU A558-1]|uniref:Dodecin domain-containing protein n=1 Tax=Haloterrigena gelatinilytica TaxID=2741724 RepID=A0ABX2L6B3_9EURY|nr:dodecin family protein [Haloterrigena gelatinilytica]NUC71814.1 dodecin domain-containing protein [Haloterrigena gelatinilytica]
MGERAEIVELVGSSTESWEDAVQNAMDAADGTIEHVSGVEIDSEPTETDREGETERYVVTLEASFDPEES